MNGVISVEDLGKRYLISSQQIKRYAKLSDVLTEGMSSAARRLVSPFTAQREKRNREEFWALRHVDLEIKEGERVGIIGRNGSGKSTLLKLLSRITEPTEGSIRIRGRVSSLLEVGTGFHPDLTGRENIYLNGAIMGMTKAEIGRKFDDIVAFSEVQKFLDTPVKRYSSGMSVRLAFAVAAHLEPEILIVDEVLAVGDAAFQRKCLGKMDQVSREGRTVIFVSHNMAAISSLTNRAVVIEDGRLGSVGETQSIIRDYLRDVRDLSPNVSISERADREGNGKARIVDLSMVDGASHVNVLPLNRTAKTISMEIFCSEDLKIEKVTVGLFSTARERILWLESSALIGSFDLKKGKHRIDAQLGDGFSLPPGDYYLNVSLMGFDGLLDYVGDALKVQVEEGDFFGTGKLPSKTPAFFVAQKWTVDC